MPINIKITGSEKVIANVLALPKRMRRRGFRVALDAAGGVYKSEVMKRAPRETGLLRSSMGVKTVVPDNERAAWVKVGPRRGFKRAVTAKKSGGLKLVAKKTEGMLPPNAFSRYRNPTRYAHLTEGGTRNGVKAKRWMSLSASLKTPEALAKMQSKLRAAVYFANN